MAFNDIKQRQTWLNGIQGHRPHRGRCGEETAMSARPAGRSGPRPVLRCSGVLAATGAGAALAIRLLWLTARPALATAGLPGTAGLQAQLVVVTCAALAVVAVWLVVVVGASAWAAAGTARGRQVRWAEQLSARLAPAVLRRLAAAALGVSTLTALAGPASASAGPPAVAAVAVALTASATAAPGDAVPGWPQEGSAWQAPAPPPVPPAPSTAQPTAPLPGAVRAVPGTGEPDVVVRRGDTLWAIAARHLPAGATASQVALEWPRWWAANRDVVGDDPDRLLPGQLLHAPGAAA
jgi:hypothetical protein